MHGGKIGKRKFSTLRHIRAFVESELWLWKMSRVFSFRCWSDSQCRRAREHFKLARSLEEKSCKLLEDINSLQNSLSSFIPTFFLPFPSLIVIVGGCCWCCISQPVLRITHVCTVTRKRSRVYIFKETIKPKRMMPYVPHQNPNASHEPPLCSLLWCIPNSELTLQANFLSSCVSS